MRYTHEKKFTRELIDRGNIGDDDIYRDLIVQIIHSADIDDLHSMFELSKIDPHSEDFAKTVKGSATSLHERERMLKLEDDNCVLYLATCNLP